MEVCEKVVSTCEICYEVYDSNQQAESCCKPDKCADCGVAIQKFLYNCDSCRKKEFYSETKILKSWDGAVLWEDSPNEESYFSSIDSLLRHCKTLDISPPRLVYACKTINGEINVDSIIDDIIKDTYPEVIDDLVDFVELKNFIAEWNKKQNVKIWKPDYEKIIIVTKKEI